MRISHHVTNLPLLQYPVLEGTVAADLVTNSKFFKLHAKIILSLVAFILILKLLPSPLFVATTKNTIDDSATVTMAECEAQRWCKQGQTIVETVIFKKLNPLQR